ncbi:MAG: hypothetical protein KGL46_08070 [Hyphomicrobiales bacterium]|nr:hypothetical protein [Hyphomicrobiales bacterium]
MRKSRQKFVEEPIEDDFDYEDEPRPRKRAARASAKAKSKRFSLPSSARLALFGLSTLCVGVVVNAFYLQDARRPAQQIALKEDAPPAVRQIEIAPSREAARAKAAQAQPAAAPAPAVAPEPQQTAAAPAPASDDAITRMLQGAPRAAPVAAAASAAVVKAAVANSAPKAEPAKAAQARPAAKKSDAIAGLLGEKPKAQQTARAKPKTAENKTAEKKTAEKKTAAKKTVVKKEEAKAQTRARGPNRSVMAAQRALQKLGFVVRPDGVMDSQTRGALAQFSKDSNLTGGGALTAKLQQELASRSGVPAQ